MYSKNQRYNIGIIFLGDSHGIYVVCIYVCISHGCFIAMACVAFADVTDIGARRQKCLATALDNNRYRVSR